MAQNLGTTLKSDEEFSYITSGFVRTNETANNISKGRGEASLPKLITNYDITGNWFLKISADELSAYGTKLGMQGGSVELMAHWAYEGGYTDALYELTPRAEEFIQKVILKNLPKWKRVSIMVSHDIFVMPLAVFGSKGKVALKYHEDYHWINYIAGLAIIIGADILTTSPFTWRSTAWEARSRQPPKDNQELKPCKKNKTVTERISYGLFNAFA